MSGVPKRSAAGGRSPVCRRCGGTTPRRWSPECRRHRMCATRGPRSRSRPNAAARCRTGRPTPGCAFRGGGRAGGRAGGGRCRRPPRVGGSGRGVASWPRSPVGARPGPRARRGRGGCARAGPRRRCRPPRPGARRTSAQHLLAVLLLGQAHHPEDAGAQEVPRRGATVSAARRGSQAGPALTMPCCRVSAASAGTAPGWRAEARYRVIMGSTAGAVAVGDGSGPRTGRAW